MRLISVITSIVLAASLFPAPALAEAADELVEISAQESVATEVGTTEESSLEASAAEAEAPLTVSYRMGAEEQWRVRASVEEAVACEADDIAQSPLTVVEAQIEGSDARIEFNVREVGAQWAEAWRETTASAATFEEIQVRLAADDTFGYEVWYRVHAGEHGWLGWARDGESAGSQGFEAAIDGLQLVLVEKGTELPAGNAAASIAKGSEDESEEGELEEERSLLELEAQAQLEQEEQVASEVKEEEKEASSSNEKSGTAKSSSSSETGLSAQATPTITYQAHVQRIGWQKAVTNGGMAGTSGQSLRMEALRVSLPAGTDGGVTYKAHVQRIGWQNWVSNGADAGTSGQSLRVEAFQMKLTGNIANKYDIYYRTHIQRFGWLAWAKNGESTGSAGLSMRMEALEVQLVPKGGSAPSSSGSLRQSFINAPTIAYRGHVQRIGWQGWMSNGATAGTTGQSLRVESLQTSVDDTEFTGEVQVNSHVQRIGWESGWSTTSGTTGRGLRLEAFRARLTGELEKYFDVYYRVHAQRVGWMGWAKNGEMAGTSAMSLRLEAIEMQLVIKGGAAPGSTDNCYIDGNQVSKLGYQNPSGFYQVSSKNVTITSAAQYPFNYITPSRIGVWATRSDCVNAFIGRAQEYLGTAYVWDYACAPGVGVDCIGLVYQCAYACGMDLGGGTGYDDFNPWAHWSTGSGGWHSHDANNFWNYGKVMHVSLDSRQPGDVIYWSGHVAIYLGNDQIIEAYPGSVSYASIWDHGSPVGCMRLFQ